MICKDDIVTPPVDDYTADGAFRIAMYHTACMLSALAQGDARGATLHGKASLAWTSVMSARGVLARMVA